MGGRRGTALALKSSGRTRQVPGFDLLAVAERGAGEAGMPLRLWPSDDCGFLAEVLRAQHTPEPLIARLNLGAPAARIIDRLAAALGAQLRFVPIEEVMLAPVLLLLGPPGAGKTTLAAKLAARLGAHEVLVVTTDTVREGAIAQLEEYTKVLGLPVAVAEDAATLRRVVAGASGRTVIVDTGGISLADPESRDALREIIAAAGADPILVLPGDVAANEAAPMAAAAAALGARLLFVTRLDLVRRIGGVLAGADAGRLALVATSVTPHFAYGLRALTPEVLARRLLAGALNEKRWQVA